MSCINNRNSLIIKFFNWSKSFLLSSTSTPAVGSSKIKIGGLCTMALATNNLLFIPPDKLLEYALALSSKLTNLKFH